MRADRARGGRRDDAARDARAARAGATIDALSARARSRSLVVKPPPPPPPSPTNTHTPMAATILCRFLDGDGQEFVGQPTATDAESGLPTEVQLLAEQNIFGDLALGEEKKAVSKVLAPLDPKAILCIGLNYAKHAAESGMAVPKNPVLFMKTVSTLNHPGDPIGTSPTSSSCSQLFDPTDIALCTCRLAQDRIKTRLGGGTCHCHWKGCQERV